MTDFLNRRIEIGDAVVYPTRQGSHMWLSRGDVVETDEAKNRVKVDVECEGPRRRVGWVPADRLVVV